MDNREFCKKYLKWFPENKALYDAHKEEFPQVLLHIFASSAINRQMYQAYKEKNMEAFRKYYSFIEFMWKNGDEKILNVLDVTVLEELSDHDEIWRSFGENISRGFVKYINNTLLNENIVMRDVTPL